MKVLFLCTGNSCRSQIAEAYGRRLAGKAHRVWSAGTSPKGIHPLTAVTLAEEGLSVGDQRSKDVDEISVEELDLVVTLCRHAEDALPEQLAGLPRVHWDLEDPAEAGGSEEERRAAFRRARDEIARRVAALLAG